MNPPTTGQEERPVPSSTSINYPPYSLLPSIGQTKYLYNVISFFHNQDEFISNDAVQTQTFTDEQTARDYMKKTARELYATKVPDYYSDSNDTYFHEENDSIDFGNRRDGYRSFIESWGFVKIEKNIIDDNAPTIGI